MKLRCLSNTALPPGRLTIGRIYDGQRDPGGYNLTDDRGIMDYYLSSRFEQVSDEGVLATLFNVKCMDNDGVNTVLTVGCTYQVVREDANFYYLNGKRSGLHHGGFMRVRFEVVRDIPPTLSSIKPATTPDQEEARLRRILTSVGHSNSCSSCGAPLPCKWHP